MRILAVETSCDETGLAVIDAGNGSVKVRANLVRTQIAEHQPYIP